MNPLHNSSTTAVPTIVRKMNPSPTTVVSTEAANTAASSSDGRSSSAALSIMLSHTCSQQFVPKHPTKHVGLGSRNSSHNMHQSMNVTKNQNKTTKTKSSSSRKKKQQKQQPKLTFPQRLRQMLEYSHSNGLQHIVSWENNGTALKVHETQQFQDMIMPMFFTQIRIKSFQRQLLSHGFIRITGGDNKGCYVHKRFVRVVPGVHATTNTSIVEADYGIQKMVGYGGAYSGSVASTATSCSVTSSSAQSSTNDGGGNEDVAMVDPLLTNGSFHEVVTSSSGACDDVPLAISVPSHPSTPVATTTATPTTTVTKVPATTGDDPFERMVGMVHEIHPNNSRRSSLH